MLYEVEEIGFDTFVQTERELIDTAHFHCTSYDERKHYLPIDNVEQAIKYLTENGFKVRRRITQGDVIRKMTNEQIARLLARTYEDGMLEALQHGNITCTWEENNKRWQEWVDYEFSEVAE